MDDQLTPDQLLLYEEIDRILWEVWDPIGVNDCEEARGEYHSYVPHIFHLVLGRKDAGRIAESLENTASLNMELPQEKSHNQKVAELIVSAAKKLLDNFD